MKITHSYFVVMIDNGKRGMEAIVDPEVTRQGVIDRIKSHEYQNIVFIHHVDDLCVEDVTGELIDAAELDTEGSIQRREGCVMNNSAELQPDGAMARAGSPTNTKPRCDRHLRRRENSKLPSRCTGMAKHSAIDADNYEAESAA